MVGQTHFSHPPGARGPVLLIENPRSGQTNAGTEAFTAYLRALGVAVEQRSLDGRPLSALLDDAQRFAAVVAAGGDGTVSAVAHALRERPRPILAYPAGTANLIAQNLNLPGDPQALARILLRGHGVTVDLAELEVGGRQLGFTMLAGAGADAAMIRDSDALKGRFGVMAYVLAALKQVGHPRVPFRLTLDGRLVEIEAVAVMVANFGMANFRMPIASGISPTDGQLSVVAVTGAHPLGLLPDFLNSLHARLNLGDPVLKGNVEVFEARQVLVEADGQVPVQYDGEVCDDCTPFSARVLPKAARFLSDTTPDLLMT